MTECIREPEVAEVARSGRWPSACGDELRAHVDGCETCSEMALVLTTLQSELPEVRLPSSGAAWWRVQCRARQEAARTAARASLAAHAFFVSCGLLAAAGAIRVVAGSFDWSRVATRAAETAVQLSQWGLPLTIAIVASVAIAPVAVYLAVSD